MANEQDTTNLKASLKDRNWLIIIPDWSVKASLETAAQSSFCTYLKMLKTNEQFKALMGDMLPQHLMMVDSESRVIPGYFFWDPHPTQAKRAIKYLTASVTVTPDNLSFTSRGDFEPHLDSLEVCNWKNTESLRPEFVNKNYEYGIRTRSDDNVETSLHAPRNCFLLLPVVISPTSPFIEKVVKLCELRNIDMDTAMEVIEKGIMANTYDPDNPPVPAIKFMNTISDVFDPIFKRCCLVSMHFTKKEPSHV